MITELARIKKCIICNCAYDPIVTNDRCPVCEWDNRAKRHRKMGR